MGCHTIHCECEGPPARIDLVPPEMLSAISENESNYNAEIATKHID